jgi:hypothetical protein
MNKNVYTPARHLVIKGCGHVYPDTEDNRKTFKNTHVVLDEKEAARYGKFLKKVRKATAEDSKLPGGGGIVDTDKQVTETKTK